MSFVVGWQKKDGSIVWLKSADIYISQPDNGDCILRDNCTIFWVSNRRKCEVMQDQFREKMRTYTIQPLRKRGRDVFIMDE